MNAETMDPVRSTARVSGVSINSRVFHVCILILVLISLAASSLVYLNLKDKKKELERSAQKRLEILAGGRVEVISTWLAGLAAQGDRIIQSDVFRLYAAEIDLIEEDISVLVNPHLYQEQLEEGSASYLLEQLPMMRELLKGFTAQSGFLSGRVVDRKGRAYIMTNGASASLTPGQKALVEETFSAAEPRFSHVRLDQPGLVLDLFLPIFPPEGAMEDASGPVAILILSKAVTNKLNDLIAKQPLAHEGERVRLVQHNGVHFEEIAPWTAKGVREIEPLAFNPSMDIAFGARPSLEGHHRVYSAGKKVPELDWWVVQEADFALTNAPLMRYTKVSVSLVALVVIALALLLGGAWWVLIGVENRKVAEKFRLLAEQIETQHQFLESINSTITDYIGYKDSNGAYRYVNPAFAQAVGREVEDMIGLDDRAVFGHDTGKRLSESDKKVLEDGGAVTLKETVYLLSAPHHLLITKIPFKAGGDVIGIVSVFTDITPLVQAQEMSERRIRQTIEAFVKTVEMTDPYLAGHSRLMSSLAGSLARELEADEETRATVELAALISQIGKVFVDRETLTKKGQLDKEEMKEVQSHVEHAAQILDDMEFDLPVAQAVYQMNENLDGSGYPRGLKNDDIHPAARILAVANSFCAMIRPRSYRSALPPEKAVEILEGENAKYSREVLDALHSVLSSAEGDRLLRSKA